MRDSAGSGDSCTSGLIVQLAELSHGDKALLEDVETIADTLRFGQVLAAVNCAYDGARGMMYAMTRVGALRTAKRTLGHKMPRLPANSVPYTNTLKSVHTCAL